MENKYRINTNWSPNGKDDLYNNDNPSIYRVIINLIDELDKSLKAPMMKESKSDEEVRKILDNPAGITIEELQAINVWSIDKKLRREVRNKLDWAYRYLSTTLTKLILRRNSMPRSKEKNKVVDDGNRELKNRIVSQYEVIKELVENCEREEELNENQKKLLTYIRKVYSKVLSETTENVFSMATEDTERVKIFPFEEQEALKSKVSNLQDKIELITEKSKQRKTDQQKENYRKLESEKKRLEEELTTFKNLKDKINSSFPNLIDSEGKVNEEVLKTLISSSEKKRLENELAQERSKNLQLKKKLDSLEADRKKQLKQWEEIGQQIGSKASKIKNELESIDYSKLSAGELDNYLTELWEINKIKNLIEISLSGTTKEKISKKTIGDDEHEKLKEISDQLELERQLRDARRDAKQVIAGVLADKWAALKGKEIVAINKEELLKAEYRNYSKTLDKMNDLNEIITFERKILQVIARQRNEYQAIDECLSLAKKAIESKNPKLIKEAYDYLSNFRGLQLEKKEKFNDYNIFLEKRGEFYALRFELLNLMTEESKKETVAQIEQPAK